MTKVISPTYGNLTIREMADKIIDFVGKSDSSKEIEIIIGTDS